MNISDKLDLSVSSSMLNRLENTKKSYDSKFDLNAASKTDNISSSRETEKKRLKGVSEDFEALMINQMLKAMRKTVNKSGLIDGGMAEAIFEDMLYDEYAKEFSKTKSFGLAEIIYNQMEKYI